MYTVSPHKYVATPVLLAALQSALTSLIAVHFADLKFALSQVVLDLKVITDVAVKVLQGGRDAVLHISNILTAALRTLF